MYAMYCVNGGVYFSTEYLSCKLGITVRIKKRFPFYCVKLTVLFLTVAPFGFEPVLFHLVNRPSSSKHQRGPLLLGQAGIKHNKRNKTVYNIF